MALIFFRMSFSKKINFSILINKKNPFNKLISFNVKILVAQIPLILTPTFISSDHIPKKRGNKRLKILKISKSINFHKQKKSWFCLNFESLIFPKRMLLLFMMLSMKYLCSVCSMAIEQSKTSRRDCHSWDILAFIKT